MAVGRLQSNRFPYLPLALTVGERTTAADALLDTGFDGDVALPTALIADGRPPDEYRSWTLADESVVATPVYNGTLQLGPFAPIDVDVVALGDEPFLGRGVTDRYLVLLDHGERVVVEP